MKSDFAIGYAITSDVHVYLTIIKVDDMYEAIRRYKILYPEAGELIVKPITNAYFWE